MRTYCFDIDNTITFTNGNDYVNALPNIEMIERVNRLFEEGNTIKLFTARGMSRFSGDRDKVCEFYYDLTHSQLVGWGVKF